MKFSKEFIDAVEESNILRLKLMLKNSLVLDPSGVKFDEMMAEVTKKIPSFMDNHDGELFKPEVEWDENYFNEQAVKVVDNFSVNRVELLKKIVQKLYIKNIHRTTDRSGTVNDVDRSGKQLPLMNSSNNKRIGGAVATLGIVGVGCGILIEGVPVVVSIIGVASIGAGLYIALGKK